MIKIILTSLAVVLILFVVIAAVQPPNFRVARSTSIATPPAVPFARVNDLHKWQEMSPYVKLDPAAKYTFEGPPAGNGAALAWMGNAKVGEGRMTIVESRPNELIKMKLDFVKPFASTCMAEFSFKPEGDQTSVTWSMTGEKNFVSKAMCLFMNMDKMVGGAFEEGLANMKSLSEAASKK